MFGLLLAIQIIVTVLLILIILVQKSEGGSTLFASGSSNSMFTARGTSNILTKATWVLAAIFIANCITMAHISAKNIKSTNTIIVQQKKPQRSKVSKQPDKVSVNNSKKKLNQAAQKTGSKN